MELDKKLGGEALEKDVGERFKEGVQDENKQSSVCLLTPYSRRYQLGRPCTGVCWSNFWAFDLAQFRRRPGDPCRQGAGVWIFQSLPPQAPSPLINFPDLGCGIDSRLTLGFGKNAEFRSELEEKEQALGHPLKILNIADIAASAFRLPPYYYRERHKENISRPPTPTHLQRPV